MLGATMVQLTGKEWLVLFSDKQSAYHVERLAQYQQKGPTNGNWLPVAEADSMVEALGIVEQRSRDGVDRK